MVILDLFGTKDTQDKNELLSCRCLRVTHTYRELKLLPFQICRLVEIPLYLTSNCIFIQMLHFQPEPNLTNIKNI